MNFSLLSINTNITLTSFPETQSYVAINKNLYSNQSHWKRIGREERERKKRKKRKAREKERKEIKNQLIHTCTYKYTTIIMQKLKQTIVKAP